MKSSELIMGRSFALSLEHGEDFFGGLKSFCKQHNIKQGFIPGFIAGFERVELVGTSEPIANRNEPIWSKVVLENVEAVGSGTIAYSDAEDAISPHVHVTVGSKGMAAVAHSSHLLNAKVLFLTEMLVMEVLEPAMRRVPSDSLNGLPLLSYLPPR